MKKYILVLIAFATMGGLRAQLANTQWKTKIEVNGNLKVIFDFKKDTCQVLRLFDSSRIETMTYTVKDSIIIFKKVEGESDCDEATIGTYTFSIQDKALYFHLKSDDCDDRAGVLDNTRWIPWVLPAEVKLPDAVLQQYVGTYQLDDAHPIYITVEDGRLQAEGPNNGLPKSPLYAESETKFFIRVADVVWDFVKDAGGKVTAVISHEEKDYELKKVK